MFENMLDPSRHMYTVPYLRSYIYIYICMSVHIYVDVCIYVYLYACIYMYCHVHIFVQAKQSLLTLPVLRRPLTCKTRTLCGLAVSPCRTLNFIP